MNYVVIIIIFVFVISNISIFVVNFDQVHNQLKVLLTTNLLSSVTKNKGLCVGLYLKILICQDFNLDIKYK